MSHSKMIHPPYPIEEASIEMTLVRMMKEHRSWAAYCDICSALDNIRNHAKSMRAEQEALSDGDNPQRAANVSMEPVDVADHRPDWRPD